MKNEEEIHEKLEQFDNWRGSPLERERNAFPRDRGVIKTLLWVLEIDQDEWDADGWLADE